MKTPLNRGGLRFYLNGAALLLGQYTLVSILAGTPLVLLGLGIHLWAKGCLHQNKEVTHSGPYRYVRHPFYLGNLLMDAGIVVMSGSWLLALLFPFWWFGVYLPTMQREERTLNALFPESLAAYRARVPALIPWRRPLPPQGQGFSWRNSNIASGREIPRMLHLLAYPLLFLLAYRVRVDGWRFFANDGPWDMLILTGLLLLYGWSWISDRHLKRKQRILPVAFHGTAVRTGFIVALIAGTLPVQIFELKIGGLSLAVGLGLVLLPLVFFPFRSVWTRYLAEGSMVTGALLLCEVPWLAPAPLLFYTALLLDLRQADRLPQPAEAAAPYGFRIPRPSSAPTCVALLVALIAFALDLFVI